MERSGSNVGRGRVAQLRQQLVCEGIISHAPQDHTPLAQDSTHSQDEHRLSSSYDEEPPYRGQRYRGIHDNWQSSTDSNKMSSQLNEVGEASDGSLWAEPVRDPLECKLQQQQQKYMYHGEQYHSLPYTIH